MPVHSLLEQPDRAGRSKYNPRGIISRLFSHWRGRSRGGERKKPSRALFYLSMVALVIQSGLLLLALFEPSLPYTVSRAPAEKLDSPEFLHVLAGLTGAPIRPYERLEVFTNGEHYFPAEIAAIRAARRSVNLEAYIFQKGAVADRFLEALTERARAGVRVNLLLDAVGSAGFPDRQLEPLKQAGGRVGYYHALRWNTWPRMNNRTHRELLILDGVAGFIGGSGFADHWLLSEQGNVRWRDTMVRIDGPLTTGLQSTFAENWLEATGEIMTGRAYFPLIKTNPGGDRALVVSSSPGAGRSTEARLLFQLLLASAKKSIYITTPYFLPDSSIRDELVRAIERRRVDVRIVVPGPQIDHGFTRSSSRRLFGELLQAGAKIYEYNPSMIHCKSLIIDGLWAVVGSTNMDSRSFGLNDEVNLAVEDPAFAGRLTQDFWKDVGQSRQITYEQWENRPMIERAEEYLGALFEYQQ